MMNKKYLFISIFILMIVLSIGAVSAEDADDAIASGGDEVVLEDSQATISGTVSGGVDVVTISPDSNSGELSYDVPNDAKTIKSADVYVNIYGATTDDRYGANVNTTIKTDKGDTRYNESLCYVNNEEDHSIVHNVNDHVTKVYLNYMIHYNVKDLMAGLNGTKLTINVDSFKMDGKDFDGRIKLIALVLAYDDDSSDKTINYWVNDNQLWTKSNVTLGFNTQGKFGLSTLTNVVLSSNDGSYRLNNEFLGDADVHKTGSTYQYNQWDVTNLIDKTKDTTLDVFASGNGWGSLRNSLSVLTINDIKTTMSVATEYSNTAFAGTNNTLSVSVSSNKAGKYVVKLLADGDVVDEIETDLSDVSKTLFLTDPTIRPVDETTANGAENKKVNYTIELAYNGLTVNSTKLSLPILYNGNLGKDLAYPAEGYDSSFYTVINGDIVIDPQDVSTYLKGADNLRNRTDVWNIPLGENQTIVKSFIYVPYNWCDPNLASEDLTLFNATFNGEKITPISIYRDQGNLGGYGKYGYGVLVYDVTSLVNKSGNNTLFLSRAAKYPAIYPSILVYMYNVTGSNIINEIYINNGADLLGNSTSSYKNYAKRQAKADSTFNVNTKVLKGATLYVLAANAVAGYGDLIFNGETHENIWNGASSCSDYYELDVTGKIKDANTVSFVAAGKGNILALQQIMVLTKDLDDVEISLATEYANTAFAGTVNAITVNIDAVNSGKYTAILLADGSPVNQTEVDLTYGTTKTIVLVDPNIKEVDEFTVNGATHKNVNYTFKLLLNDELKGNSTIVVPIVYNGYLGKDLAYDARGSESFLNITINGDIVIDNKAASTKLSGGDMNRTDIWTVSLDANSNIVKSYIYVPYNWFNNAKYDENINMFNVTFNNVKITPIDWFRDQSNLGGASGKYGYGVLIYDVTELINKSGENTFVLNKANATPSVYPSVLIYMYNTTGSKTIKDIYINNGADLLTDHSSSLKNNANRTVKSDSIIDVTNIEDAADLYLVASNALPDYGNLIFNGETFDNIWNGASYSTEVYHLDITNSVKKTNNISFVGTGGSLLALQQIIVITKKTNVPADEAFNVANPADTKAPTYSINLPKGATGTFTVTIDGKVYDTKELVDGAASITVNGLAGGNHNIVVSYSGDADYNPISKSTSVTIKEDAKPTTTAKKATKITAKKATFKAKKKVKKYTITLKAGKAAVKKVKVTLKVGKKTYKATTNAKGKATFKITKLTKKGKYTAVIKFAGTKLYKASKKTVKITVKK